MDKRDWITPDLTTLDFHLFPVFKASLLGCPLQNNNEMQQAIGQFLAYQGTRFYMNGFFKPIVHYKKCLNVYSDYVGNRTKSIIHDIMVYVYLAIKFPYEKKLCDLLSETPLYFEEEIDF